MLLFRQRLGIICMLGFMAKERQYQCHHCFHITLDFDNKDLLKIRFDINNPEK